MGYTPDDIEVLAPGEIFVFSSTLRAVHGGGYWRDAGRARKLFGAEYGKARGPQGRSCAILTRDWNSIPLSLEKIGKEIDDFIAYAKAHPDNRFLVTKIGVNPAKYQPYEIAPLFFKHELPPNVILPKCFWNAVVTCGEHDWQESSITDSCGFGVAFGAERKCKKCGKHQIASHCEGRCGGPWRDYKV